MGTIDQPKPTEPKAPSRGQQPLQPGETQKSTMDEPKPSRPNPQAPDTGDGKVIKQ